MATAERVPLKVFELVLPSEAAAGNIKPIELALYIEDYTGIYTAGWGRLVPSTIYEFSVERMPEGVGTLALSPIKHGLNDKGVYFAKITPKRRSLPSGETVLPWVKGTYVFKFSVTVRGSLGQPDRFGGTMFLYEIK